MLRSYLQAEKGARYQVRVHNTSGERLGLVIAVDGRNIINGEKSELARGEPMYVLDGWETRKLRRLARQPRCHQRVLLHRLAGFIRRGLRRSLGARRDRHCGVSRSAATGAVYQSLSESQTQRGDRMRYRRPAPRAARPRTKPPGAATNQPGTGYGERRIDQAVQVEFVAQADADSRHFIKYEWQETLCRKQRHGVRRNEPFLG